jgi:serine/threonine-protein kinase
MTIAHSILTRDRRAAHSAAPEEASSARRRESASDLREWHAVERALSGQYELQRLIARGGMGAVYLARERDLNRLVAIKVLDLEAGRSRALRERFRAEARTMAGLSHPSIVPVHAAGETAEVAWYAMRYVRGESLAARLRREGRLTPDEARRVLLQLAEALDHAHRRGVIHRDVKPENILLEEESGRVVLVDFGIAADPLVWRRRAEPGVTAGTPWYMAPEQLAAEAELDGRSDVYALGVIGYLLLSGRLPFDGKSFGEIAAQHFTHTPEPLRFLAPRAPRELSAAIMRCLAKDPARRWPDVRAFHEAIAHDAAALRRRRLCERWLRVVSAVRGFWWPEERAGYAR